MNEEMISGKWKEIKGEIIKTWGHLSDNEIEKSKGSLLSLAGAIQQKYGIAKEEALQKLNHVIEHFTNSSTDYVRGFSNGVDSVTTSVKSSITDHKNSCNKP